jgi:RimJ/RimL family protein N-acetyltransferase
MKTCWSAPAPRIFAGRFITLTPLDPDADAEELFAASHEPGHAEDLWRYFAAGPFPDVAAMREWLHGLAATPDLIPFTVRDNATGRRIGSISLMRITPEHGTAEMGWIWYAPSAQRTKTNTEANFLLLRHCFAELGYRRVEWKCNADNARSRAAALRLGYSFEGIFRQHMFVKGRNRDTAWFSMLDHEWPRIAAAMERWLCTDNPPPLAARGGEPHGT